MTESLAASAHGLTIERERTEFRLSPLSDLPFTVSETVEVSEVANPQVVFLSRVTPPAGTERAQAALDDLIKRARQGAAKHPQIVAPVINLGLMLLNQGRIDDAIEQFRIALARDPNSYLALLNCARAEFIRGNLDLSQELLERALALKPSDPTILLNLAALLRRRGHLSRSIELLTKAVQENPRIAAAQYELGLALLAQSKNREALSVLKNAARCEVRSPAIHHALGVAYALNGDGRRARRAFQAAVSLEPLRTESVNALAKVFIGEGNYRAATQLLSSHLLSKDNGESKELQALSSYYEERYAAAKAQLTRLLHELRRAPDDNKEAIARVLNNLALACAKLGDKPSAESLFLEAIRFWPTYGTAPYHNLAGLYSSARDTKRVEEILNVCAAAFPKDAETQWLLALTVADNGSPNEAIRKLAAFVSTDRTSADALAVLGAMLVDEKDDFGSAMPVLLDAKQRFPDSIRVANNLAYVYLQMHDADSAKKLFEAFDSKAVPDLNRVPWTATKGLFYVVLGDLARGEELYREAAAVARQQNKPMLGDIVLQKMHLELAKSLTDQGRVAEAAKHIRSGLRYEGKPAYRRRLEYLANSIADSEPS